MEWQKDRKAQGTAEERREGYQKSTTRRRQGRVQETQGIGRRKQASEGQGEQKGANREKEGKRETKKRNRTLGVGGGGGEGAAGGDQE